MHCFLYMNSCPVSVGLSRTSLVPHTDTYDDLEWGKVWETTYPRFFPVHRSFLVSNLTSPVIMGVFRSLSGIGLVAGLVAFWLPMIVHFVKIGGVFETPTPTVLGEGQGPLRIEDTIHCEDVHHYRPANLLFTACEDTKETRFDWFPGLGHLTPHPPARGSIHVIDPKVS